METKKLLMFSCGVDSTYVAWKLLSIGTPNLHLHHISLRTIVPLWKEQDSRVEAILSYLSRFDFEYSESRFDYPLHHMGYDSDLLLLVAQKVCQSFIGFKRIEVIMGWNPSDMQRPSIAERAERDVTPTIWKALVQSAENRQYIDEQLHFPLIEQNIVKADMIKEMPKELFELTYSCRRGDLCGKCHACKDIQTALEKNRERGIFK